MQSTQEKDFTGCEAMLAVSLELSKGSWKIGLHDGRREKATVRSVSSDVAPRRLSEAVKVIEETKRKWGLSEGVRVVVVYEAGQDGFWIHRALTAQGYEVLIVDPASIPVERRARRAKTDRLDAIKLVMTLRAWLRGEHDRMHVIRVPTEEAEAQRQLVSNTVTGCANCCARWGAGMGWTTNLRGGWNEARRSAMMGGPCRRNCRHGCVGNANGWRW